MRRNDACSTPVGIKGTITYVQIAVRQARIRQCSTPVGIKGTITCLSYSAASRHLSVLNACRHQRNNHQARRRAAAFEVTRAQRLSASKEQSQQRLRPLPTRYVLSAQRLSASKEQSPWRLLRVIIADLCVLNACRHQRNNHDEIAHNLHLPFAGAQRLSASKEQSPCAARAWTCTRARLCSTPVGIKGTITLPVCSNRSESRRVLNACRHQRNNHTGRYGVIARRESAIVLNACRHQRNNHCGVFARIVCNSLEWPLRASCLPRLFCLPKGTWKALRSGATVCPGYACASFNHLAIP